MNEAKNLPVVSVIINTYNHESFIAQAIESALMQQTDFHYEIIIGDDESSDGTSEICKKYAVMHPERIRLFLRSRKNVIHVNGKPTGRYNFIQNIKEARGRYIALLPGDDYWTDPLKLQKQADLLDKNPEFVACHHWHRITEKNEEGNYVEKAAPRSGHGYFKDKVATIHDLLANRVRIKSRTVMFRNIFLDGFTFPSWYLQVQFGDVPLSMLLAGFGNFYFMDEEMAVYRMTSTGVSTMGKEEHLFSFRHFIEWIRIWEYADKWFNGKYRSESLPTVYHFYDVIFARYHSSLPVFLRMQGYALFHSQFPFMLRLRVTLHLWRCWIRNLFRKK